MLSGRQQLACGTVDVLWASPSVQHTTAAAAGRRLSLAGCLMAWWQAECPPPQPLPLFTRPDAACLTYFEHWTPCDIGSML